MLPRLRLRALHPLRLAHNAPAEPPSAQQAPADAAVAAESTVVDDSPCVHPSGTPRCANGTRRGYGKRRREEKERQWEQEQQEARPLMYISESIPASARARLTPTLTARFRYAEIQDPPDAILRRDRAVGAPERSRGSQLFPGPPPPRRRPPPVRNWLRSAGCKGMSHITPATSPRFDLVVPPTRVR